ncbi:MAG: hypothetical protein JOS17DRAFT_729315 [Linnemannia elongata]|nr:MAG: hypothetical protein JOS17DRAFT_729315 [Linnemannia elongata]
MKISLVASFLFLAAIVNAADNDFKQMCYKICVHRNCNGSNGSTFCEPIFTGSYIHIDYRRRSRVPDATIASVCSMKPYDIQDYIEADYYCESSL